MNVILRCVIITILCAVCISVATGTVAAPSAPDQAWRGKIDAWVMERASSAPTEFLIFLSDQADLSPAASLPTKEQKGAFVYAALASHAASTQKPLLRELDALGIAYRPFWVANMVWAKGDRGAVEQIAARPDVAHIYANPLVAAPAPIITEDTAQAAAINTVEWNINHVGAPLVWAAGFSGQGVVIAGQDTGYEWTHPALKTRYRGWDGSAANHDYAWHDAIHSSGGFCPGNSPAPCDDHNHGTHTMGTMLGDDGLGNQIGMAPGAKWIGCRNMDQGSGTPATYAECYQWFIAPTRMDGSDPNPALAPDVINNSWGCPPSEGCTNPNVLLTVVQNVRAAGIVTVHSAGNAGPSCSTVRDPAAIYDESFTVGSTTSGDGISSFSSRGPVVIDGSGRRKPDISAPGSLIRSSVRGGGYAAGWSGTSMAGPHVAGLVALLISANPSLRGNVDAIEDIIRQSAVRLFSSEGCGGDTTLTMPNNTFGWGRIDAWAAYRRATAHVELTLAKQLQGVDPVRPGQVVSFTVRITNTGGVTLTALPLRDGYPAGALAYSPLQPASPPPDVVNTGVLTWSNLAPPGGLAPGAAVTLVVPFQTLADTSALPAEPPCNTSGKACNTAQINGGLADLDGAGGQPPLDAPPKQSFAPVAAFSPTGATLADSAVTALDGVVVVAWRTVNETDVSGFALYRRPAGGEWVQVATLAAQRAGQPSGAEYAVLDAPAQVEYLLQVIRFDQTTTRHELGVATPARRAYLPLVVAATR